MAISSAGPPWFRSVAQMTSSPSPSLRTVAMSSSRAGSSLGLFARTAVFRRRRLRRSDDGLCRRRCRPTISPKQLPVCRMGGTRQITAPSCPYPAIQVPSLDQRSGHRGAAGGQSYGAVTTWIVRPQQQSHTRLPRVATTLQRPRNHPTTTYGQRRLSFLDGDVRKCGSDGAREEPCAFFAGRGFGSVKVPRLPPRQGPPTPPNIVTPAT